MIQKASVVDARRFLTPLVPEMLKAKGLDLDKIGLDPAEIVVTYKLDNGEEVALQIGRKLEDQPEAYARCNKSPFLFTVADWMKGDLEVNVKNRLFTPPR